VKNQTLQAMPNLIATDAKNGIKTTCPYCGVGCGVQVLVEDTKFQIRGDQQHPANFGKLCIKGKNLADTIDNSHRLTAPTIHGESVTWDRATDYVAHQFKDIIAEHGPDSVAFYVSGQLLTEDYYVANKLMKGFIGSANIDTNSRLCMSSAVAAHKRAFGEDIVPMSYADITKSDLIVLSGSNLAWCHPILYKRIRDEKTKRPELKVVVIDPRVTASNELADLHLPIRAGGDLVLFNGLLNYLAQNDYLNCDAQGLEQALLKAQQDLPKLANIELDSCDIQAFYTLFAESKKVVTLFSMGINQSEQGVDQGNAIINCHLASGKIAEVGSGPFSITGQPNAMGGREVGALANTLAGHIEFSDTELVDSLGAFWQSDNMATEPGLKAVDLFDAIDEGSIKAIWVMATNPAVSMPNSEKVRRALQKCPLVVVSDCVAHNDTIQFADVVLPAKGWGEKSGTVTNSERRISRQRAFLESFSGAKADWWIISAVAQKMGFKKQFNYSHEREVFLEHAKLSGLENQGTRAFDISAFSSVSEVQYQNWVPVQWPQPNAKAIMLSDQLMFERGEFFTPSKKAQIIAVNDKLMGEKSHCFTLNTGRARDQWHTQTRTGKSALLSNHYPEPMVEIHPEDAFKHQLLDQSLVNIISKDASLVVRVKHSHSQTMNSLFMPIHWSSENSHQGAVGKLVTANFDPISGQPAFKHAYVDVSACSVNSEAQLVVQQKLPMGICFYQVEQSVKDGYCYHLASQEEPKSLFKRLQALLLECGEIDQSSSQIKAIDDKARYYRQSYFQAKKLLAGVFVAANKKQLPQGWVSQFYQERESDAQKRGTIASNVVELQDQKIFCQCLKVPVSEIKSAIADDASSVENIRKCTGAGNSCGSCIGDISLMLDHYAKRVG